MTVLQDLRDEIAEAVNSETGIVCHTHVPNRLSAPAFVIEGGRPYVTPGPTFGGHTVSFVVVFVAATSASNFVTTEAVDNALEDALVALVNAGYTVEEIGQLEPVNNNGVAYVGARIFINTNTTF